MSALGKALVLLQTIKVFIKYLQVCSNCNECIKINTVLLIYNHKSASKNFLDLKIQIIIYSGYKKVPPNLICIERVSV